VTVAAWTKEEKAAIKLTKATTLLANRMALLLIAPILAYQPSQSVHYTRCPILYQSPGQSQFREPTAIPATFMQCDGSAAVAAEERIAYHPRIETFFRPVLNRAI
jgi:hypothetical protein